MFGVVRSKDYWMCTCLGWLSRKIVGCVHVGVVRSKDYWMCTCLGWLSRKIVGCVHVWGG